MWAYWVKQLILSTFGSLMKYDASACQKHCFHMGLLLLGCVGTCPRPVLSPLGELTSHWPDGGEEKRPARARACVRVRVCVRGH